MSYRIFKYSQKSSNDVLKSWLDVVPKDEGADMLRTNPGKGCKVRRWEVSLWKVLLASLVQDK